MKTTIPSLGNSYAKFLRHSIRGHIWGIHRVLTYIVAVFPADKRTFQNEAFCIAVSYLFAKAQPDKLGRLTKKMQGSLESGMVCNIQTVLCSRCWAAWAFKGSEALKIILKSRNSSNITETSYAIEELMLKYEDAYKEADNHLVRMLPGSFESKH